MKMFLRISMDVRTHIANVCVSLWICKRVIMILGFGNLTLAGLEPAIFASEEQRLIH
jgi:hypothetical protein